MTPLEQTLCHNLQVLGTGHALARLVDDVLRDYPDPYELALRNAQAILQRHTGKKLDPERVWWHQFNHASSSSRSFTGWVHSGPPGRSMGLLQLMIQRFDLPFQDASDELDVYGGFYRQGPGAAWYDERNEVRLLARDVQADFWALDLGAKHCEQVATFWSRHAENFRVLAKINLLAQIAVARDAGRLAPDDAQCLRQMADQHLTAIGVAPTLEGLRRHAMTPITASWFAVGGSDRAAITCLRLSGTRVVVYLPWAQEVLRAFETPLAMAAWLRQQLQDGQLRAGYLGALTADPHAAGAAAIREALQALADTDCAADALALLLASARPVVGDYFALLAAQAREEMRRGAERITSNSELRSGMWRGYLGAFLKIFGSFAPLGWPAALVLLGATVGKVGLDVDAAIHAKDAQGRKAALRTAMLDSVFAALGMIEVGFGSSFASLSHVVPFHENDISLRGWTLSANPAAELEVRVANRVLGAPIQTPGLLQGITMGPSGDTWIALEGVPYRVRYSPELEHWLVVPSDNPFAYVPLRPVRLSSAGEWELLERPRLLGGSPPSSGAGLTRQGSAFWDEYMRTDLVRSNALSNIAKARHRALLAQQDILFVEEEGSPQDADGFFHVMLNGEPEYTYRDGAHYRNDLIYTYTEEDSQINSFLREGRREFAYGDEVEYVNKLADSLVELPKDSDVPLYRGGFGGRGTSGQHFRNGQLKVGDLLVSTDLTSFTENPYIVRRFAADTDQSTATGVEGVFDDTSVVFELPAGHYERGVPITLFSSLPAEAETLFLPGTCFRIENLSEIEGADYHFVNVVLREVSRPASGTFYELRTGQPFDLQAYAARLDNQALASRFFED
ncbi:dermonecrotic toxin domain-containing protein [Pseudomonas soli]|uniref:dermonecrotic toxin domain-containing protein n=1 Tax=Pseudomonas soli TaxID=1306993 RepID=UPI003DA8AEDD